MNNESFWNDKEHVQQVTSELKQIKQLVRPFEELDAKIKEIDELIELSKEYPEDQSFVDEIKSDIQEIEDLYQSLEFYVLFNDKHDSSNAYLSINAGAGGTEACDWAEMLYRMYSRWAEKKGFASNLLEILPGEEAGIKNCTLYIKGDYAYGQLKSEIGVHRLVRISPFDANSRRHTSFVSVDVIPEIEDDIEVSIDPSDLRIDTYRSQGAGGQHVNTTDSAVRITHLPTGIVVSCQNERSQHKNKAFAMKMLKSRLYEYFKEKAEEEKSKQSPEKKRIEWGSQIRSYVFHPYTLVKDHRTNYETGKGNDVLDGNIDLFIDSYLRWSINQNKTLTS